MHSGSPVFQVAGNSGEIVRHGGHGVRFPAHVNCDGSCSILPPLFYAVQKAPGSVVENLLKAGMEAGVDPDQLDDENRTPLQHAANFMRYEAAVALIKGGADIDFSHKDERITAVHVAARVGCTDVLGLLLAARARHDRRDTRGFRPLHHAVFYSRSEVAVKMLIAKGCDIEAKTSQGLSYLALAAMVRLPKIAQLVIDAGASVTATGVTGLTALHLAAGHGAWVVAHVLLAAGADPEARDKDGDTPLDVLGSGEGMDGNKPARESSHATERVLCRAPAYRSPRAWLWPAADEDCRFDGGNGGSGKGDVDVLTIPAGCLLARSESVFQARRRLLPAMLRWDLCHGCSLRQRTLLIVQKLICTNSK